MSLFDRAAEKLGGGDPHEEAVKIIRERVAEFDIDNAVKNIVILLSVVNNEHRTQTILNFIDVVYKQSLEFTAKLALEVTKHADHDEIDHALDKMRKLLEFSEYLKNLEQLIGRAAEPDDDFGPQGIFTTDAKRVNMALEELRIHFIHKVSQRKAREARRQ